MVSIKICSVTKRRRQNNKAKNLKNSSIIFVKKKENMYIYVFVREERRKRLKIKRGKRKGEKKSVWRF